MATGSTAGKRSAAKKAPVKRAAPTPPPTDVDLGELTEEELAALAETPADDEGPIAEDGTIRPVEIGKRGRTPNEMVTIFVLDGVDYQIPSQPSPAVLIKFMRESRNKKIGAAQAVENLLLNLLGQDALDALAESPEVTEADVGDVLTIVGHIGFGALAKLKAAAGNS
jgi:hypothetical protein